MNFDEMVQTPDTAAPARRGLELRKPQTIVVAGLPTVSLLPREFRAAARDRTVRRVLVGVVVLALVLAGGSAAGATLLTASAQDRLDVATAQSQKLIAQLAKFRDVQMLQQSITLGRAGKAVGSSTELDWQNQIGAIEADMPADYAVSTITADSASPLVGYPQGTTPLEQPRAATVTMNISAPTITVLPIWLRKLRSIPAYADATATVSSETGSGYAVLLTIHLSPKALLSAKAAR